MEKNGRVKAVAAALGLLLVMLIGSVFGFARLGVCCPLRTALGIVRVVGFERPHVTVRRAPRVMVARAGDAREALISFQALRQSKACAYAWFDKRRRMRYSTPKDVLLKQSNRRREDLAWRKTAE